ncbi:AMP-binding protein [Phenylobacterium montanum]|uniref:AMP-binding protein n=1 Tax=Phenylobacterium montanum TaxID=2823693 RepID=A0A975G182_9CAUL|nr:AMP-binding protein [Caulobacter sp. S6]QUD88687.1 AMP-binding protein [Caulobacter sp. S6]
MKTLFDCLDQYGDAIAVIDEEGRPVTYAALLARAASLVEPLGARRRLVAIEIANRLTPLAAYVGAIRAGHAVILTTPGGASDEAPIVRTFRPEAVFRAGAWTQKPAAEAATELHPDLAVLLSTSGSTGSPKLVRLSHGNLAANARSIIDYLGIGPDETAITTLPPAYSYGLSVIHSHLLAGARLALFDGSVTDPAFAQILDRDGASSFAGVPHIFDLLRGSGFEPAAHPSLRYVTQAGGRLPADQVLAWATQLRKAGKRFFVMYGQTEAAPRIAYVPAEDIERHPDCIGRAVPGGRLRIEPIGDGEQGELVYAGPNVMMGYAEGRADLTRGAETAELRTGDIARVNDAGYFQITGRLSRISKVFGLRISLDEIEARLAQAGLAAAVAADDEGLAVACAASDTQAATDLLLNQLHLPKAAFLVLALPTIPRLSSGKTDYAAILRQARDAGEAAQARTGGLRPALAAVLGVRQVRDEDSFISLGGDSLNYVRAWLVLEEHLGRCPENWETMSLAELEGASQSWPQRRMAIDSDVLARAVAIVMVVMHHVTNSAVGGGAYSLLLIAGMNFSRFQVPKLAQGQLWSVLEPLLVKVLAPYFLIISAYFVLQHGVFLPQYLLVSNFSASAATPDPLRTTVFWYIETYVWLILAASLMMLAPGLRRLGAKHPWPFALGLVLVTLIAGSVARLNMSLPVFFDHTPFTLGYLFAFGWAIPQARTTGRRLLLLALGAGALFAFERPGIEFAAPVTLAALTLLLFVRRVTLGWKLTQVVSMTAAASLYIYLSHGMVVHALRSALHGRIPLALALPAIALCCLIGIGLSRAVDLAEAWALARTRPRAALRSADLAAEA